jgi:hypothetical protein
MSGAWEDGPMVVTEVEPEAVLSAADDQVSAPKMRAVASAPAFALPGLGPRNASMQRER